MPAVVCVDSRRRGAAARYVYTWPVRDYDLAATLNSGQVFRWEARDGGWEGVVDRYWVRLTATTQTLTAETVDPLPEPNPLVRYLRLDENLDRILASFPDDPPLRAAVRACRGLRLLRQDPWECLASFILSSTKQIPHIRRIVTVLCERYGEPVAAPPGREPTFALPRPERLAACSEAELRACGMGFRAPYLRTAARRVADGEPDLPTLWRRSLPEARAALMSLPGVGRKIADCVLLFAMGFDAAFPVDVWVRRALAEWYFPRRRPTPRQLLAFSETHFGPYAGYAQQYLFHYRRGAGPRERSSGPGQSPRTSRANR